MVNYCIQVCLRLTNHNKRIVRSSPRYQSNRRWGIVGFAGLPPYWRLSVRASYLTIFMSLAGWFCYCINFIGPKSPLPLTAASHSWFVIRAPIAFLIGPPSVSRSTICGPTFFVQWDPWSKTFVCNLAEMHTFLNWEMRFGNEQAILMFCNTKSRLAKRDWSSRFPLETFETFRDKFMKSQNVSLSAKNHPVTATLNSALVWWVSSSDSHIRWETKKVLSVDIWGLSNSWLNNSSHMTICQKQSCGWRDNSKEAK